MKFERGKISGLVHSELVVSQRQRVLLLAVALLPTSFVWGCGGVTTQSQTTPPPSTYSISGTISPAAGGSGATVTLSGMASATMTANASGNFTFTGLANGNYAITPSLTGYTYSPNSQSETVSGANISGVNFTATAQQTHSVSLSWTASTSAVVGYNVYRSTGSPGQYAKVNSSLVNGQTYTDTTVQSGKMYFYVATSVDSTGNESVFSTPPVSATIP